MSSSHISQLKPSPLLAIVCLAIVSRLRPTWVTIPLKQAACEEGINPQRLSRVSSRVIAGFETVLKAATRIGRPTGDHLGETNETELAVTRALLGVAQSILAHVPLRKTAVHALVVGSWLRLHEEHPQLTQSRFCKTLGLPERTLRSWIKKSPPSSSAESTSSPVAPTRPPRPRKRPPRRPRFGFDVILDDTQFAADTTDLSAFDVSLKLIAAQDIGGRDQDLFDAIIVDDHESADLVAEVLTNALRDLPGAQAITDQGTPYLAKLTRDTLDDLEVEHAPQREADPQGKATVERAFETVKSIARPLLILTNRIARAVPTLSNPTLAKAATTLLLTALLRAYQAGARATRRADDARSGIDVDALQRVAKQSRERARAEDRSARLLLEHIHGAYQIDRPLRDFVRGFRRFPLSVLHVAERDFARQAHRDDIRNRAAYFGALVRFANDAHRKNRAGERNNRATTERLEKQNRRADAQHAAWLADPAAWLRDALDTVADQWHDGRLLFGGSGLATTWMTQALARLLHLHGPLVTADVTAGVFSAFQQAALPRIHRDGVAAVRAVLCRHLDALPRPDGNSSCAASFAAILRSTGSNPRPPPSSQRC